MTTARTMPATRKETAMWLLERLVPDTGVNNVTVAFEVTGRLDRALLARALNAVIARHEVLRTVFVADLEDGAPTLTKQLLDEVEVAWGELPATGGDLDADLTAFAGAPFVLDGSPLVRAALRSDGEHDVCCVVVHHLIFDATSTSILLTDLLSAYETLAGGGVPDTTPLAQPAPRPHNEASIAYWRENLDGLTPSESGLWCAKEPGATASLRAETVYHSLSPEARDVVRKLRRQLRASEAVVLLAAYSLLLAQHGAGSDVVIGSPVNVRDPAAMNTIGYHANLLPLRVPFAPDADFAAVVKRTRDTFLEAISHADVPLELVSPEVIANAPGSWRSSFFRHLFNYMPGSIDSALSVAGLPVRHLMAENGYSRFDLEFFIMPSKDETRVRAAFCVDAFDAADVVLLLERFDALLVALGEEHDRPVFELSRFGATDRDVLASTDSSAVTTVPAAIHARVQAAPDAVAIVEADRSVTYGELWSSALATRDMLVEAGADRVAVAAPRGADFAAGLLGAWLAGAGVVPLDPALSERDAATRMGAAGSRFLLTGGGITVDAPPVITVLTVPAGVPTSFEAPAVDPGSVAYFADAPVTHQALAVAAALGDRLGASTVLWLNTATSPAFTAELLAPLCAGGRVVVAPDSARADGGRLAELLDRHAVDVVHAPPAVLRRVLDTAGLAGRTVLSGHERLSAALAAQVLATGCRLLHGHVTPAGYVSVGEATGEPWVSAGAPLTRVSITEPGTGHELGVGVRGELRVDGQSTGELAQWRGDGTLDVLGPLTGLVSVDGQQVSLSWVETVLVTQPDVDAVVAVGTPAVVAFVEPSKPGVAERLREHARAALPAAAVPVDIVVLDELPRTIESTVDFAVLDTFAADAVAKASGTAEADELVLELVATWKELLDRLDLNAESNFFTSGGHSLLGAQLVQRVKKSTGMPVALGDLFANPTPRGLAEHLRTAIWDDDDDDD